MDKNKQTQQAADLTAKLNTAREALHLWTTLQHAAVLLIKLYDDGGATDHTMVAQLQKMTTTATGVIDLFNAYIERWQPEVDKAVQELTGGDNG